MVAFRAPRVRGMAVRGLLELVLLQESPCAAAARPTGLACACKEAGTALVEAVAATRTEKRNLEKRCFRCWFSHLLEEKCRMSTSPALHFTSGWLTEHDSDSSRRRWLLALRPSWP